VPGPITCTPFVGRQRELAELWQCLEAAGQGQGTLVLVAGEPGIGKTRLVCELAERARAQGWQVLAGRAYESEGMPPYLPFIEAVRPFVRTCPVEDLRVRLGRAAPSVALLIPEVRDRLPDLPPSSSSHSALARYQLFESVTDFLLAIACSGDGLLLCLDDLHWADISTLLLLQHLARKLVSARMLVVSTYRTIELGHAHPLIDVLADLSRERLSRRVMLTAFSPQEADMLIEGLSSTPAAPSVAAAIYHETAGNPFFLEEVVWHLQAQGRDLADPATAVSDWGIPEGVRYVIAKRCGRLSAVANQLLQAGAVLGDGFSFDVLTAVSGLEATPLLDALDEVLAAGVLREEGDGYYFTHALIRQTLIAELSLPRKQRLHQLAAEAIERVHARNLGPHLATLAYHFGQAAQSTSSLDKAIDYAARAGARATTLLAYEDAASHYGRALQALEARGATDEGQHCDLLLALGDVQRRAGDFPHARETFQRAAGLARQAQLPDRLARAALGYGARGETEIGSLDMSQVGLLEEALRVLGGEESALRARVLAGLARALYYSDSLEWRTALSQQAVAMARRVGDPLALADALNCRHAAIWGPESTAEQLDVATELVHLAEQIGDSERALQGHHWRLIDLLELGEVQAVDVEIDTYIWRAEEVHQPLYRWYAALFRTMRALLAGRFEDGERLARQALELGQQVQNRNATVNFVVQMFVVRREQGRLGELEATLTEVAERIPEMPAWRCGLAYLYSELGRRAEARRVFEHLAVDDFAGLPRDAHWLSGITLLSEVCAFLGDARRAAVLYHLLLPYAGRNIVLGAALACRGAVSRILGVLATVLARWDAAAQHFEEALTMNARLGASGWLAHTYHEYAMLLLARDQRGDRAHARALLEQALRIYRDLGVPYFAAKAEALLGHPSRARAPVPVLNYPDNLSPREVEVLRLIAAGRSNREIAAILFISLNTVARHVSNIFVKTNAANRAEAATYAIRHGLAE
jgi:DNA-binding CsgD family transcriptional regulator/tetratricopeptide (TPR) repeat protein